MPHPIHDEDYKGYKIAIYTDEDSDSPRVGDNLGHMVCFHGRYTLGDKHDLRHEDYPGWVALEMALRKQGAVVVLPLYLYNHSGITMNTTGFSCPWDSGQVGFIYATKKDILARFGKKVLTSKLLGRATEVLEQEVKTYDAFISGEVYGYGVFELGDNPLPLEEPIDSCWGYYGLESVVESAKEYIDNHVAACLQARMREDLAKSGLEE